MHWEAFNEHIADLTLIISLNIMAPSTFRLPPQSTSSFFEFKGKHLIFYNSGQLNVAGKQL